MYSTADTSNQRNKDTKIQNLYSTPSTPDEINLPKNLKNRTASQIKAVFSSLEKQHNNKTANLWKLNYQKALLLKTKDTKVFCEIMKELSHTPAFPLSVLARIKSYELCLFDAEIEFDPDLVPEWLKLELAKAFYKRKKIIDTPEKTLKSTIYLAKNSPYKELRISYLKHALSLAQSANQSLQQQELQQLLYKESPSLNPQPKQKEYFLVAEDFRINRKFKQAKSYYIKVLNSSEFAFQEQNLSFKGLGIIYKVQRNKKQRIINSNQWSKWLLSENTPESLRQYYKKQLQVARQKWNFNENQQAIQIITNLLQEEKSKFIKEEALYLRGAVYFQENQKDLSLKDWDQVIASLYRGRNKKDILAKAIWKKAWLYREKKQYGKALKNFILLEKINRNSYTNYRALFWRAKTLEDLGYRSSARKVFTQLIDKDHFGYYGLLARNKLNHTLEIKKQQEFVPTLIDKKMSALIHWLLLFKETELLALFLQNKKDQILGKAQVQVEQWLQIIWLWVQAKEHLEIFRSINDMDNQSKEIFLKEHLSFLFPLDFHKEVKQASKKWGLPESVIFAIIRQESAFNPRARSPADAFGLMQLIPSTARQTAKENKIVYRNFKDLYRPSKNILLGSAHLKKLIKKYDNNFVLAAAAYNAGSTPVNRWKQELQFWGPLEFIENIPYEETRTYVRLIIRNYIFYYNLLEDNKEWFPKGLIQER